MPTASAQPMRWLLLALLAVVVLTPSLRAENLADGEVHKNVVVGTAPNQAVVNVKYDPTTGKSYIVVVSGTLKLNSGATTMASVPAGGAFVIDGFSGLSATYDGLDLGRPKIEQKANSDEFNVSICLGNKSASFNFTPPNVFRTNSPPATTQMTPNLRATTNNVVGISNMMGRRFRLPSSWDNTVTSSSGLDSFDRTQLSAIGG